MSESALRWVAGGEAIPISVITGFLGSGKTTLLNRLLRDPAMGGCAVLVNEFGEVGIDHLVVREVQENVVLLASGCLCCAVRSDLVDALRFLSVQRLREEVPPFDRIVVETTGLADPVPVIHTLITDPLLLERFRLDALVTTVDACHGAGQLDSHPEAMKQAALADRLVLTKLDLRGDDATGLRTRLHQVNPGTAILPADSVTAGALFGVGAFDPARRDRELLHWLDKVGLNGNGHHDAEVRTICLRADRPIVWDEFAGWLGETLSAHGPAVLRTKGILDVAGRDRPVVINGVQHVFYPADELQAWPEERRRSQVVFITRNLPVAVISETFRQSFGTDAALTA